MGMFDSLVASGALDQIDVNAKGKIRSLTDGEILECLNSVSVRSSFFGNSPCSSRAIIRELEAEARKRGIGR